MRTNATWLAVSMGLWLSAQVGVAQYQVTLGANASLNAGANLGTLANSGGTGTRAAPYLYSFTTGGLDLGAYKVTTKQDAEDPKGTSFILNMGGYSVAGSGSVAVDTVADSGGWEGSGSVAITNVGDVSIGGIDTYTPSGRSWAGSVQIGSPAARAGAIRVDRIHAYCADATGTGGSGPISIAGSADVRIQTSGGVAGDIRAYAMCVPTQPIAISHDGSLVAYDVINYWLRPFVGGAGWASAGSVSFNGDASANGASGALAVHDIDTHVTGAASENWIGNGGDVTVSGYLSVSLNAIDAHRSSQGNISGSPRGGNVAITNISGDVRISGLINLDATNTTGGVTVKGALTIACGGAIAFASLDLSKLSSASLSAGGNTTIAGLLTGTDGNPASGLGNIGTSLRVPGGQKIYYKESQNPALNAQSYTLASLLGTPGGGGLLCPKPRGTAIAFR